MSGTVAVTTNRVESIDIAKGIAILLVVIDHVSQGMYARHMWPERSFLFWYFFIYAFHMPAFFFISGIFVNSSVRRHGMKGFLVGKLRVVLYPYVLWTTISIVTLPLLARFKTYTTVYSLKSQFMMLLRDDNNWFLITLFLCLMVAAATINLPGWARFALAVALLFLIPHFGITPIDRPILMFPFVAAGMWIGSRFRHLKAVRRPLALAASFALFAVLAYLSWRGVDTIAVRIVLFTGIIGTVALAFLSCSIEHSFLSRPLAWIGEASLAIFLLSPFGQGAGRELARMMHAGGFWGYLLGSTIVAVLVPALIWHLQKRLPIVGWLFYWPSSHKTASLRKA